MSKLNPSKPIVNQWEELYDNSHGLRQANSSNNMFAPEDVVELQELVKSVLREYLEVGELHKGMKVYVEKELNNHIISEMANRPPGDEESIEEWCSAIFGSKKFGVIFNSLESYDNELTEKMCSIISPLLRKAGLPLGGLSFLFFMGNYGFTPFGIHKEAKGEEGFLFHLGPASKQFYTWDDEELNKIEHNAKVFHEVEEMLPDSKCYKLKPRSVMFIPHHLYHIGNTNEFSLSIVMDYINPSQAFLEKSIAQEIGSQEVVNSIDQKYVEPISMTDKEIGWQNVMNTSSWEKRFKSALQRKFLRLKSNSGVLLPAIKILNKEFPQKEFVISGKSMFPIFNFIDSNGQSFIIARGHEFPVNSNSKISSILNKLNNGEIISFDTLDNECQPEWDHIDIFGFVNELWQTSAIDIKV